MMNLSEGGRVDLSTLEPEAGEHVMADIDIRAIEAALWSGRPLLLFGEPGVGKSQFAKAAAAALGRGFVSLTVDSRAEARDLRWRDDPVARLAAAQVAGLSGPEVGPAALKNVAREKFIIPGPLWWAFDPKTAKTQGDGSGGEALPTLGDPSQGVVALIDEIDKAEADVPNGLLEALGAGRFPNPLGGEVRAAADTLVIIASNEDRPLPPAFIRRCAVHRLRLPTERGALIEHLFIRGAAQLPGVPDDALRIAAEMTADDRTRARELELTPLPGLAEFIDLLRAAAKAAAHSGRNITDELAPLQSFFLQKHDALRS